jgi:hypothetical protein
MLSDQDLRCRVCGLQQVEPPWGEDDMSPTYDICDCCGVEFGYEDSATASVKRYRLEWLQQGAPWFRPEARPPDWDPEEQIKRVPESYR